jgi:hypothetical protein
LSRSSEISHRKAPWSSKESKKVPRVPKSSKTQQEARKVGYMKLLQEEEYDLTNNAGLEKEFERIRSSLLDIADFISLNKLCDAGMEIGRMREICLQHREFFKSLRISNQVEE